MDLYYVVRTGVYDQGVVGICDSLQKARNLIKEAKEIEPDNYHNFDIRFHRLNEPYDENFRENCVETKSYSPETTVRITDEELERITGIHKFMKGRP